MSPNRRTHRDNNRFDPGQRARDHRRHGHPHRRKRKRAGETPGSDDLAITLQKLQVVSYAATQPLQQNRLESVDVLPIPYPEDIGRTVILRGVAGANDRVFTAVQLSDDTIAWIEISVVLPRPDTGGGGGTGLPTFVQNFSASSTPYHVAFGSNGRLYLSGPAQGVVKSFDAATGTQLQHNGQHIGTCGTTMAQNAVYGIALDTALHLFLRDASCYQEWDAGSGTGSSDFGAWVATFGGTTEGAQSGLWTDSVATRLWIADTTNHLVKARSYPAGLLVYAAGSGPGSGNGNFNAPRHLVLNDARDTMFVADTGNNRVQVFTHAATPTLTYIATIGSAGSGNGELSAPHQIAIDGDGRLHVVEQGNHRVSVFLQDGTFQGAYGSFGTGIAQLSSPRGIAIDRATGRVAVCDSGNNRISMWSV